MLLPVIMLLGAGLMVYGNAFHTAMVLDDHPFIIDDAAVHVSDLSWESLKKAALEGKPPDRYLPNISFAVNYYFSGLDTFGYHVVNIAIHLVTGILLFFFYRITLTLQPDPKRAFTADVIAFFAALIWVVHPVGTQSVTYICQRMASMVALMYVLSLFLYVKGRLSMIRLPGSRTAPVLYFAGCAFTGLCALATKENAGTLPIIILLFEWFFFQNLKLKFSRGQLILAGLGILSFCVAVFWYMGENPFHRIINSYAYRDFTLTERVMTQWRVIIYYISLFFYPPPSRLNLDHDYPLSVAPFDPPTTLMALTAILGLFVVACLGANKHRLLAFALLWFFITQATESTIIGVELIFEHRTYIPFMMISLVAVIAVSRVRGNKILVYFFLSSTAAVFGIWTFQRNHDWRQPVVFWKDCIKKSPFKWRPNYNLAKTLYDAGNIDEAISQYRKTLEINPSHVESLNNLATALLQKGKTDEAIRYYEIALKITPNETNLHVNLGNALAQKGNIGLAVNHYRFALKLRPEFVALYVPLGKLLVRNNQINEAVLLLRQALGMAPENPHIRLELANTLVYKGLFDEAVYQYETILLQDPSFQAAAQNRSRVLSNLPRERQVPLIFKTALRFAAEKHYQTAIGMFQQLLALRPDDPAVYYNISCLYALQNRGPEAVEWLRQAVRHGYSDWNHLKSDPDMKNIQQLPYVRGLLENSVNPPPPATP